MSKASIAAQKRSFRLTYTATGASSQALNAHKASKGIALLDLEQA
jgi:hypothetical protein